MRGSWSPRRWGGCERAGLATAGSSRRPHGSNATGNSGPPGSKNWTRSSNNSNRRRSPMDVQQTSEPMLHKPITTTDRRSDREVVVTRTFDAPARIVFKAWTTPELLMKWWTPASFGITFISCEADVRTGGTYRFVMGHPDFDQPMTFHGRYLEVVPGKKLVWTNEEGGESGSVTTVTFEEK